MRRVTLYRVLVIAAAVLLLEVLCLTGVIDRITMPPPHRILRDLAVMLVSGIAQRGDRQDPDQRVDRASASRSCVGIVTGGASCTATAPLRETLGPALRHLLRGADLRVLPAAASFCSGSATRRRSLIGFMLGVVAVIVNTLNGLDRVPQVLAQDRADPAHWARSRRRCAVDPAVLRRPMCSPAPSSRSPIRSSA